MPPAEKPNEATLFPSVAWFQRLAAAMNANRARQEQLGYVDCVAEFRVTAKEGEAPWALQVTFDEFSVVDVCEVMPDDGELADFALEASLATWRDMIESIEVGSGRPALDQTLNHLTHMGLPMRLLGSDPLRRDLYFRYNQSLQEFFNAAGSFHTRFHG